MSQAPRARAPRRRRTVARRVLAAYAGLLVVFTATLVWCFLELRAASREARLLREGYVPLQLELGEALAQQNVFNAQLNHITAARNPADVREWIETARRARPAAFARLRAAAERLPQDDPATQRIRSEWQRDLEELGRSQPGEAESFALLFQALAVGDTASAARLQSDLVKREADAAQRLKQTKSRVDDEMSRLSAAAQARETRSLQVLAALAALTLAVGLAMSFHINRLLRPLRAVTARAEVVASGDLRPRPAVADDSEIGELARTFERMVEAIAAARGELVQAERLATIGKMAAHVTHEIRNPLSSIGLNLELLEEELRDARSSAADEAGGRKESVELLAAIRAETARLSRIAEQYLSIARRPAPTLERESIADLVSELLAFLRAELERGGVRARLDTIGAVPEIDVDEAQLRQALLNLVRNAREAMPSGGELVLRVAPAEGGGVDVTIEDEGVGIPDDVRASIFDPFFTTKQRGTGLGLAVTREIIEAHGGVITCEPRTPRGTRFRVHLPERGAERDAGTGEAREGTAAED
jgi:two-component system NtrC family sensor kinase